MALHSGDVPTSFLTQKKGQIPSSHLRKWVFLCISITNVIFSGENTEKLSYCRVVEKLPLKI